MRGNGKRRDARVDRWFYVGVRQVKEEGMEKGEGEAEKGD